MMMATQKIVDAIQHVTARVQDAIDAGERSRMIDADDLVEVLLAIAGRLEAEDKPARSGGQRGTMSLKTRQNRGVDSCGRPSVTLFSDGMPCGTVRPPEHLTAVDRRAAWLQGFQAGVKATDAATHD